MLLIMFNPVVKRGRCRPTEKPGSVKYGLRGMFSEASFRQTGINSKWRAALIKAANHSLAQNTWSSYRSALKSLEKCSSETGTAMTFPLSEEKALTFIGWLLEKNLTPGTINTYLSGIRQAHLTAGIFISTLRSPVINQIMQGACNLDAMQKRLGNKPTRLPVTPAVLKLIKAELKASPLPKQDKLLYWTICTIAFMGAFRIHELLSRVEGSYDPSFTLLGRDVNMKTIKVNKKEMRTLTILLKSEKSDRVGKSTIVDVYESGGMFCPVRAFEKWKSATTVFASNLPAFRLDSGKPLTGRKFNTMLKQMLGKHLHYERGRISSHSFRSGMASLMGKLGYTEQEIQAIGRWSSQAYQTYLKLPRTQRMRMARHIGNIEM